jgi:hypothetical protein
LNRYFLDCIVRKLKPRLSRLGVSAFLACALISFSSIAQDRMIPGNGDELTKVTREPSWQEELFRMYFDTIPCVGVDSHPSRYAVSPDHYKRLQADSVHLFKGIHELQLGNTRKAIGYLQKSAEGVRGLWYNNSNWYLGLAYLRINELPTAEYLIYEISEMEIHPNQLLAAELYQKILTKKLQTTR